MSQEQHLHHAVAERLRTVATLIGTPASEPLVIDGQVVVPGLGLLNPAAQLNTRADRVEQGHLRLTAVGAVSRGKSTLLNACLGEEIFPTGSEAVTGGICQAVYGSNNFGEVTLIEKGASRTMPYAEFCEWISLSTDEQPPIDSADPFPMPERLENLDYAVLQSDASLCEKGIRLTDTLGFNAGPKQEQITQQFLRVTDALLIVLETKPLFDSDDVALVNKHYYKDDESGIGNMFFAINDFGILDDEQLRVLMEKTAPHKLQNFFTDTDGKFDQALFDRRVFLVNAKAALEAKVAGAADDVLEQTGILALERALERVMSEGEHVRIAVDAAMASTLLPALEGAESTIQHQITLASKDLEVLAKAVHEAEGRLAELTQKAQNIRKTIESRGRQIGSKVANHFKNSVPNHFVKSGRRAKAPWHEDWNSLEMGSLLSLKNVAHAAISKRKRDELAAEMQTRLTGYIHSLMEDWGKKVLEHIQPDINKMLATTEGEVKEFAIQLNQIQRHVAGQRLSDDFVDMDKRRGLKIAQMLGGVLLLDPNQIVGPMLDAGWKPFIVRLVADIVAVIIASILASFFTGPVGWAVFFAALIPELILVHKGDRAFMLNRVRDKIGEQLRNVFVKKSPEFMAEIQANLEQQFTQLSVNLQGTLDSEIATVQHGLDTALETRREGQAAVDAEKARLETIGSLLTAQFEEVSTAVYGRVLTSKERKALVERFLTEDEDDA